MGKTLGYGEITVANMTEPFTVMLTNEAQQFATDSNRKVTTAQSYYTDIIVIRGSQERTDYTIGNITSGSGITVSKSGTRVTFSVSAGTTISADAGVIEIPITLDGQTVKKQFSWSCGKQGVQGVKGEDGSNFAWNLVKGTGTAKEFTPQANVNNSTTVFYKLDLSDNLPSLGDKFTISCDIEWTQFTQGTGGTFSWWFQGSTDGSWNYDNPFMAALQGVQPSKDTLLNSSGSKHLSTNCTISAALVGKKIFEIGIRFNYSDGTGTIKISNLKIAKEDKPSPWCLHPDELKGETGDKGKSVQSVIEYYLATSASSGVTTSTSGWSTDPTTQKLTADKKYLWNCYQTKYSDGTSEPISTPKVIGVYGDKGVDGQDGQDGAGFHWNLLSGTKDFDKTKMSIAGATSFDPQKYLGLTVIKAVSPTSGYIDPVAWNNVITPTPNTQYTISFYAKASVATRIASFFYPNCTIKNVSNYHTTTAPDGCAVTKLSTEWNRYSVTWTTSSSVSGVKNIIPVRLEHNNTTDGATVYFCGVKIEQSDKPSPWCTTYEETLAKNLSITPSSQYFKSTDGGKTFAPNTITIKPTIQGEISFGKWQYSIDGGVSFADVVSGQKGLTINNNVLSVSKDSSLYSDAVTMVTFRAVANDNSFYDTCSIAKIYDVSDIGDGRNLLLDSSKYTSDNPLVKTDSRKDGFVGYTNLVTSIELEAGQKYVIQAQTDGNWTATHDPNGADPSKKLVTLWLVSTTDNLCFDMRKGYATFTIKNSGKYHIRINQYSDGTTSYTIKLWNFKLEKGSSPTGWTPAPEDVQTEILSTKSEISSVSSKVDQNTKSIENKVENTTYQNDLKLVKGDISKANEGLNKWRYEIYPKSLFTSEYQGKSTMDVFAKNTNLTPSQSVLINDTNFGKSWSYGDNYIGYALTFVKFSAAKSVAITFKHDDGAHLYLNGKLVGGDDTCNTGSGQSLTLSFVQGWNCLEVVLNEKSGGEYIGFGTIISAISECQLMNCYYGTPVARQSHITNQLVQNTIDIDGVSTRVGKVTSVIGEDGENFTDFKNDYSEFKQTMNGFKTTVGQTYVTKSDFNGLEIGGRNLVLDSKPQKQGSSYAVVSRHLSVDLQEGVTYTISFCGRVVDGDGSLVVYLYRNDWKDSTQKSTKSKENTVISWQFTPKISGTFKIEAYSFLSQGVAGGNVYLDWFKVEKGNKSTDWTPAPEDIDQQITAAETIASQTADKFNWLVKSGTNSTDFELTDRTATLVASAINMNGLVTFSGLNADLQSTINNKTNVSYLNLSSGGNTQACWKIATIKISGNYTNQDIIIGVNHRANGYTECRIQFQNAGNPDPGLASFRQTGRPSKCWRIIKTATSTWELYLYKTESWDGGRVVKYINLYDSTSVSVTWSGENADLPSGTIATEQMIADQTTIDGGIITTGYISADRIAAGSITADKIATDAIKSRNYISSGGTQGSFLNLSDGSFTSPNLSWDSNGNLIATGANLSGKITATKGKIGSFNLDKSLYLSNNSPYYFSQFCAKKVYGLTNEGDIYIGSEGIYSYSWETGNMYIGDSGSIQADVSSSRGVCIENGEIHIYKSDYCKDYPTACDNKYGLVLAGGYVASANYSDGGSIDGFNFILSPNKFNINGKIYASNELQTGGNQVRIISGNIGCMLRNDSVDFYILRTNSGDPYGGWTDDRPFRINWASNDITCGHNLTANDLIANSWLYCSEVHSSGAVVIGADSESFYWAHGFQIARGTSWGGVCIGDDSHQLRLYGSSIWASHSISTSDENLKENFTTLDQYEDFYMNLNPIGFNYIGDYDGKKTHFGFGAHKTENILESEGYDANKFAVVTHRPLVQEDIEKRFGKDVEVDIETEYGVSYTEFIALNTHMIQKTRRELTKVKQEKADLEARLQAIEARLGL